VQTAETPEAYQSGTWGGLGTACEPLTAAAPFAGEQHGLQMLTVVALAVAGRGPQKRFDLFFMLPSRRLLSPLCLSQCSAAVELQIRSVAFLQIQCATHGNVADRFCTTIDKKYTVSGLDAADRNSKLQRQMPPSVPRPVQCYAVVLLPSDTDLHVFHIMYMPGV
jgi:hypothetical protein